jgi:hypothetical protein
MLSPYPDAEQAVTDSYADVIATLVDTYSQAGLGDGTYDAVDVSVTCSDCTGITTNINLNATYTMRYIPTLTDFINLASSACQNLGLTLTFDAEVDAAIEATQEILDGIDNIRPDVVDQREDILAYEDPRFAFTFVVFLIPFIQMGVQAVAFICKSDRMFRIDTFLGFSFMLLATMLMAWIMPYTAAFADICKTLDSLEEFDLSGQDNDFGLSDLAVASLEYALLNYSLLIPQNLSVPVSLAASMNVEVAPDQRISSWWLNITSLDGLQARLNDIDAAALYDQTSITDDLVSLNTLTNPDTFLETDVETCDVSSYPSGDQPTIRQLKWYV